MVGVQLGERRVDLVFVQERIDRIGVLCESGDVGTSDLRRSAVAHPGGVDGDPVSDRKEPRTNLW